MKDKTYIIQTTKKWIEQLVIGLNLCPFAKHPFESNMVRYQACKYEDDVVFFDLFLKELQLLEDSEPKELSTTLIIVNKGLDDFLFFLDILETCHDILDKIGMTSKFQLASFHPDYQFQNTEKDDVTNYTNKSPYPIIHILRSDDVKYAAEHYDTENIPLVNQETMKKLGLNKVKRLMKN